MRKVDNIAFTLVMVGAFNWGLIGFLDFNPIEFMIAQEWVVRAIYAIVGVSAIYLTVNWNTVWHRRKSV